MCKRVDMKKLNGVGIIILPCLTFTLKVIGHQPSLCKQTFTTWNALMIARSLGGQTNLCSTRYRPSWLTELNALVRSMNMASKGLSCSMHFSWSRRWVKMLSMVDCCLQNLHWDSVCKNLQFLHNYTGKEFTNQIEHSNVSVFVTDLSRLLIRQCMLVLRVVLCGAAWIY